MRTLDEQTRRDAVRVPLDVHDDLVSKAVKWYSRHAFGDVADNGLAMLHNKPVLRAVAGFERRVDTWSALDGDLKTLALMSSARSWSTPRR